jgi:hypothetical protein
MKTQKTGQYACTCLRRAMKLLCKIGIHKWGLRRTELWNFSDLQRFYKCERCGKWKMN